MSWFRRKSMPVPGEPRSGVTLVSPTLSLQLGDTTASPAEVYRSQPAVRAVVKLLSEAVASTPLHAYLREGPARVRLPARNRLVQLLEAPNGRTSGYRFVRDLVADLCLYDGSYTLKVRGGDGQVGALVRLPPGRVQVETKDSTVTYVYNADGGPVRYAEADVIHTRGYSPAGDITGVSPMEALRAVLAEDLEASRDRARFWRNSGRPGMWILRGLDAPDWGDEARDRFREDVTNLYTGGSSFGIGVLEEGMQPSDSGAFSPKDAEFIAGRELTANFVCRVFNVPVQALSGGDRNMDAAHRSLYQDTLPPIMRLIEEDLQLQLVGDVFAERAGQVYVRFNLDAKLRGSFRENSEVISRAVGGPWMTPDEARSFAELPPVPGGDELLRPLNVAGAGEAPPAEEQ